MKNKIVFLFNSLKQSVINKPIAFALLIVMFFVTTICCSNPSRWLAGGVNEIYSSSDSLSYRISVKNFREKYIEIGNLIRDKIEGISFDEQGATSSFSVEHYDLTVYVNNNPLFFEKVNNYFAITAQDGITEEDIEKGNKVIAVSKKLAMAQGIVCGDIINVYGNDFVVQEIVNESFRKDFVLPYNITFNEWYNSTPSPSESDPEPKENIVGGSITKIKHSSGDLNSLKHKLKKFGCEINNYFDRGLFVIVILVMAMLVICLLSSISIMSYWLKCNSRKYSTYKSLGCSPTMLAVTMLIETLLTALFAIGLGLISDYVIGINMHTELPLGAFKWLHYLMMIGGPLIGIMLVTVIAVVRRAKAEGSHSKSACQRPRYNFGRRANLCAR